MKVQYNTWNLMAFFAFLNMNKNIWSSLKFKSYSANVITLTGNFFILCSWLQLLPFQANLHSPRNCNPCKNLHLSLWDVSQKSGRVEREMINNSPCLRKGTTDFKISHCTWMKNCKEEGWHTVYTHVHTAYIVLSFEVRILHSESALGQSFLLYVIHSCSCLLYTSDAADE